jgi:hypothetical protein
MTKTLIGTTWRGLEAKVAEGMAWDDHGGGEGTSTGAVKPPKFDRTTSWSLLRCQF